MLKNKHLARGAKNAAILSRLNDLIDNIKTKNEVKEPSSDEDEDVIEHKIQKSIVAVPNATRELGFLTVKQIVICVFQICNDGLYPFLLYLLKKNTTEQEMTFIPFPSFDGGKKKRNLKKDCIAYINKIYPVELDLHLSYAGFYETDDNNVVILRATTSDKLYDKNIEWVSSHEIINTRRFLNYPIHKNVIELFEQNTKFLFLRRAGAGAGSGSYEVPNIGYYYANDKNEIDDIYREYLLPSFGKCYYLYLELPPVIEHKRIIRTAFFAGTMAIDKMDTAYDSILCTVNNIKRIVIKNYNQQMSLSKI
jgi:hypothetical protein